MNEERELTLREYVEKLHPTHGARREYDALLRDGLLALSEEDMRRIFGDDSVDHDAAMGTEIAKRAIATADLEKARQRIAELEAERDEWQKNGSDGYHTFAELYDHRIALWAVVTKHYESWRSRVHSDGSKIDGWFVVGVGTEPGVQMTYHVPDDVWDAFAHCETLDRAPEWDGHSSEQVVQRLYYLCDGLPRWSRLSHWRQRCNAREAQLAKMRRELREARYGGAFQTNPYVYLHHIEGIVDRYAIPTKQLNEDVDPCSE